MENQIRLSESYAENKQHEYNHYSHSVGVMMFHLEWKPKYGYKMFKKEEQKIWLLLVSDEQLRCMELKLLFYQ